MARFEGGAQSLIEELRRLAAEAEPDVADTLRRAADMIENMLSRLAKDRAYKA